MSSAPLTIREASEEDWSAIWRFMRQILAAAETYAYDPDLPDGEARIRWMKEPAHTLVAVELSGKVIGSAITGPNREGPGAHVATASFMVDPDSEGQGAGRALAERVFEIARAEGFEAMQFNAVVETNTGAVALWESLGMRIVGTVPEAFDHPTAGRVGLHVMHCRL